jgi:hypothetical protein
MAIDHVAERASSVSLVESGRMTGVGAEFRVDAGAVGRHAGGGALPWHEPLAAQRVLFKQGHAGAHHVDLGGDAKALIFCDA